jgi:hypothetical protein
MWLSLEEPVERLSLAWPKRVCRSETSRAPQNAVAEKMIKARAETCHLPDMNPPAMRQPGDIESARAPTGG